MILKYFYRIWQVAFSFCCWFSQLCRNFSLIQFHVFIFVFVTFDFGIKSKKKKKSSPRPLTISSRNFMVLDFTFKSFIHFELICVYGIRYRVQFNFFVCGCSVFPTSFINEVVLSPLYILQSWCFSPSVFSLQLSKVPS